MTKDATQKFLNSLPRIKAGESFWFACHPGVVCFNACCADLTMPLTPYDVLRLCLGLDMGSEQFLEEFVRVGCHEDTGFPLLHLRMEDGPGRPCPFVGAQGCGVYEHRSSACRSYPLGRAVRQGGGPEGETRGLSSGGGENAGAPVTLEEQYFLVREEHCLGFERNRPWTTDTWLADQGLEKYNRMNDRYMRLVSRYRELSGGAVLSGRYATMALLCLYQQDRFLEFLQHVKPFSRLKITGGYGGVSGREAERIVLSDPEERLCFAFDWLELLLLGSSDNLTPQA